MKLHSSAFDHEGKIPSKYTCDGDNISPPFRISDVPAEAQSLVLIMDDPDVPYKIRAEGVWDHWIVYNIPPGTTAIAEGEEPPGDHGQGTAGNQNYYGPCPPDSEHRYYFNLYALDTKLTLKENPTKPELIKAMEDHIVARAIYMGRYERVKK